MAYLEKSSTPLKWHRFRQILIMPVMILGSLYALACFVIDYFKLDVPQLFNIVTKAFEKLDIDMHTAGNLQTAVLIGFGCLAVFFLFELIGWLKSLRWKKASLVLEILLMLVIAAASGFAIYAVFMLGYADKVSAAASSYLNKRIEPMAVKILTAAGLGIVILYAILNFFYYLKRRKLYGRRKDDDDDIPFIEDTMPEPKKKERKEPEPEPILEDIPRSSDLTDPDPTSELEQTAAMLGLKFCTNCGTRLSREDMSMTYCKYCGKRFEKK